MSTPPPFKPGPLRAGVRVSAVSITWTLTAGAVAVVAGLVDGSLVAIAFGLTGLLDAAGSVTLLLHFRHALRHEAISLARERLALRIVAWGLVAVGSSTAIESVRRIAAGSTGHRSGTAVVTAAASAVVLGALAIRKRRVAAALPSDALAADAWLSATGAGLGIVTTVGAAAGAGPGRSWIDPAAALIVAVLAAALGWTELRREERALPSER